MMTPQFDVHPESFDELAIEVCRLEGSDDSVLSEDERRRAARFHRADDGRRWVAGRSWLRRALAARLDVDPSEIRFGYGSLGKPVVTWPESPISFSFSHSGETAMLATGPFETVGVDVERLRPGVYDRASASIVLSATELSWIEAGSDQDSRFLRCWVRKEAYGKAVGSGLQSSLSSLDLLGTTSSIDGLHVFDLVDEGLLAAVAVPCPELSGVGEKQ